MIRSSDVFEQLDRHRRAIERTAGPDEDRSDPLRQQSLAIDVNAGRELVGFRLVLDVVQAGEVAAAENDRPAAGLVLNGR